MGRLDDLYQRSPVWLQTLAVSGMGLRLRRQRYGGIHRATLEELRRTQWFPEDRLLRLQVGRVQDVVQRAQTDVALYRDRWRVAPEIRDLADLRDLPIVDKSDLQGPRDAVTSSRFADRRLNVIHTGGTTGRTLMIYCTAAALQINYAFFARFREWAGVGPSDRVATFAGRAIVPPRQAGPPYWRHNLASRQLLCSSYHLSPRNLPSYAAALQAFRPRLIDSYPSSIEPIARYLLEHDIRTIRPRAVITSSETLSPTVRDLIAEAFQAPVFDHYGSAEMAGLITQCESGSYHSNPEFGVVEVLRGATPARPGEAGEIVATGFVNPVMPFVRYRTGDLAVPAAGSCRCGRAFPVFERILGRMDDMIITTDGRRVGRMDPILKAVSSLHEARIIQDAEDHVLIEVVVPGGLPDQERRELVRQTALRLGPDMRIDVATVDSISRTPSGKRRMVENRVHAFTSRVEVTSQDDG